MLSDPLSDFLTRLRNAQAAHHEQITLPSSRLKLAVAKILEQEGYVGAVQEIPLDKGKKIMEVGLKYLGKAPFIHSIKGVSKPGCRVYRKATELPRVLSDQGMAIISTSMGIMTNKEARKRRLGGEVLCEIY